MLINELYAATMAGSMGLGDYLSMRFLDEKDSHYIHVTLSVFIALSVGAWFGHVNG